MVIVLRLIPRRGREEFLFFRFLDFMIRIRLFLLSYDSTEWSLLTESLDEFRYLDCRLSYEYDVLLFLLTLMIFVFLSKLEFFNLNNFYNEVLSYR